MNDLFSPPVTDISLSFLSQIFGPFYVGGGSCIINCSTNVSSACQCSPTSNILSAIFYVFNLAVLTIGILGAVYFTIIGLVSTAHEGEFMGKKYNNIWIPLRMVIGIAVMIPVSSGYSFIQVAMMWVIVNGVGAADTIWTTGLNSITQTGSIYSSVSFPQSSAQASIGNLFTALVCDETSRITSPDPNNGQYESSYCSVCTTNPTSCPTWCNLNTNFQPYAGGGTAISGQYNSVGINAPSAAQQALYTSYNSTNGTSLAPTYAAAPAYVMGPNGACGILNYCDPSSDDADANGSCNTVNGGSGGMKCSTCTAQIGVLQNIISTFRALANQFAQNDYAYLTFFASTSGQANGAGNNPMMVQYCASQNIPTNQCCIPSTMDGTCQNLPPPATCPAYCHQPFKPGNYTAFPGPSTPNQNQDLNDSAVTNIIWPYFASKNNLSSNSSNSSGSDFIALAVSAYTTAMNTAITGQNSNNNANPSSLANQPIGTGGWIQAGEYYFTIASMNGTNLSNSIPLVAVATPNSINSSSNAVYYNRNNYSAAQTLMSVASGQTSTSALSGAPGGTQFAQNIGSMMGSAQLSSSSSGGNPMSSLISQGQAIIVSVEISYAAMLGISIAAGILGYLMPIALGTGLTQNPAIGAINAVNNVFSPPFFAMLAILIGYGGLMAVYVPLIPFVIFTTAAMGWLISVVEAMVAGPIVALGIMSPSGQHEFLGKADHGLMMLFNIFLRPTLMIIGMFTGILLASVGVGMVNAFWGTITSSLQGSDPISFMLFLGAKLMLIIAVINKCFSAIYELPNRTLTWMGGQPGHETGGEALESVKGGVKQAGDEIAEKGGAAGQKGLEKTGEAGKEASRRGSQKGKEKAMKGMMDKLSHLKPKE